MWPSLILQALVLGFLGLNRSFPAEKWDNIWLIFKILSFFMKDLECQYLVLKEFYIASKSVEVCKNLCPFLRIYPILFSLTPSLIAFYLPSDWEGDIHLVVWLSPKLTLAEADLSPQNWLWIRGNVLANSLKKLWQNRKGKGGN